MKRWQVLAAGMGVVLVAGCNDSGKAGSDFRTQATAICKRQHREVETIPDSRPDRYQARVLKALRRHLDELRRLDAPPELTPRMQRWLAAGDELLQFLHRQQRALAADMKLLEAAIKREPAVPRRKLTRWDLEHPTASIISKLEKLPEYQEFERHSAAIVREGTPVYRRFLRLGRELGLSACVTDN